MRACGSCALLKHPIRQSTQPRMHRPKRTAGGNRQNRNKRTCVRFSSFLFFCFFTLRISQKVLAAPRIHSNWCSPVCEVFVFVFDSSFNLIPGNVSVCGLAPPLPQAELLISDVVVFIIAVCWQFATNRRALWVSSFRLDFLSWKHREHREISVIFPTVCHFVEATNWKSPEIQHLINFGQAYIY